MPPPRNISLQPPIPCALTPPPPRSRSLLSAVFRVRFGSNPRCSFLFASPKRGWIEYTLSRSLGYTCLKRYLKNSIEMIQSDRNIRKGNIQGLLFYRESQVYFHKLRIMKFHSCLNILCNIKRKRK